MFRLSSNDSLVVASFVCCLYVRCLIIVQILDEYYTNFEIYKKNAAVLFFVTRTYMTLLWLSMVSIWIVYILYINCYSTETCDINVTHESQLWLNVINDNEVLELVHSVLTNNIINSKYSPCLGNVKLKFNVTNLDTYTF